MSWSLQKKKKAFFLYRSLCPKELFLTFVFYFNIQCTEYTFRRYILLHIKKHFFIHFFCLFLKSPKTFSVSLRKRKPIVNSIHYFTMCLVRAIFLRRKILWEKIFLILIRQGDANLPVYICDCECILGGLILEEPFLGAEAESNI